MKTGIIIIIVLLILVVGFLVLRNKSNKTENTMTEFVRLDSQTESTQHLPLLPENWISEIEQKWNDKEWGIYDNEHYDICEKICNDIYSTNKYWEKNQTHADFLNELTKEQRIYFTLINFESQVNNGGVNQFLFNYPELSILAIEGMKETGMEKLATDYEIVLNEYFGKFDTIQDLYSKFQNNKSDWNKRFTAFAEGYKELPSAEKIEDYFYEENFVKTYQQDLTKYVKVNRNKLFRTELRNGEIRQEKRDLKFTVSYDYGENTKTISENATAEIIKSTMKSINWNKFHIVQLEDETGDGYKALHVSGSLGNDGLASGFVTNEDHILMEKPIETVDQMTEILLDFLKGENVWRNKYEYK